METRRVLEQAYEITLTVALSPLVFAIDCWCFGPWKVISESRPGRWAGDKFWDTFGWQPNGPPR